MNIYNLKTIYQMKKLIDFIRSDKAPVFGLMAMIFGLFQMYAKVYYVINPYPIHWAMDLTIALIVASGFAVDTTIIIVHTTNKNTPFMFAFFDFAGYVLYFANSAITWYVANDWAKIGGAIFIALLSAVIIYNFGEIFISQLRAKFAEIDKINELNNQYSNEKQTLQFVLQNTENEKQQISDALQDSKKLFSDIAQKYENLQSEFESLQSRQDLVQKEKLEIQKELEKLQTEKASFLEVTDLDKLERTLIGQKRAFTRAVNEGRNETAEDLQLQMIANASILNLNLEPQYLNHFDLFAQKDVQGG